MTESHVSRPGPNTPDVERLLWVKYGRMYTLWRMKSHAKYIAKSWVKENEFK